MQEAKKGYELIELMAQEKIPEGTKFKCTTTGDYYKFYNNYGLELIEGEDSSEVINNLYSMSIWLNYDFILLEEETDIQEYEFPTYADTLTPIERKLPDLINENRRYIKQLGNKIKENN